MSQKYPAEPAVTLRDVDIRSERVVSLRSLLGILGVAAGAILSITSNAPAADSDVAKKPAAKKGKKEETDSD